MSGRQGGVLGLLTSLVWTTALLALALGIFLIWEIHRPGPSTRDTDFTIARGASVMDIARELKSHGAIRDVVVFRLASEMYAGRGQLKAGTYEVKVGDSLRDVLEKIEAGRMKLLPITVAEGLTSAMIVEALAEAAALTGPTPKVPDEGSLLPETYMVEPGATRAEVLDRMRADQKKLLDELWPQRARDLPFQTQQEALTLASIVEKETGVASERPRVAAVFVNRLRRGMPLQSDPTIIYGITKGRPLGRGIRKSELERRTPYNTYFIPALPPTPIANPGRDAIAAVLNPPTTNELYFVADGTGGHVFAATYDEHNANVARWREIERQRAAQAKAPPKAP
jgi:UPF0755 protein